jgi:hypothetical protein
LSFATAKVCSLAPLAGRGWGEGVHRESVCVEKAPHPDLLPASGEKEKNARQSIHKTADSITHHRALGLSQIVPFDDIADLAANT